MLFFYIRHGDPIYSPDSLTPLGEKQAEAVAKRLALYGIDKVYSSSSNRAVQTAKPTCDLLKKEMEIVDFANEGHGWQDLTIEKNGKRTWLFHNEEIRKLFTDDSVISLGHKWYEHESFTEYKKGIERVSKETVSLFKSLGYERIGNNGIYKVIEPNDDRIAFFAHQGFGMAFLSEIMGIPYPVFSNHFDLCHSSVTVIEFTDVNGYAIPKILTLSSDSHLYREGLPLKYNHRVYF